MEPKVFRADTTPAADFPGPFDHLDIRWVIGPEQAGAELVAFGETTYPGGPPGKRGTHEMHYHPNAEEVVLVTSGRGEQVVGDKTLEVGPGDICFIPREVPHKIRAAGEEDLVIYWVLAGAADLDSAGYVPVPDDEPRWS